MPSSKSIVVDGAAAATQVSAPVKKKKSSKVAATLEAEGQSISPVTKGRKTRGGGSKIITKQQITTSVTTPALTNIILNLKCSMSDLKEYNEKLSKMISNPLEYNSSAPPEVKYYDGESKFGSFIRTGDLPTRENKLPPFISFSTEETENELSSISRLSIRETNETTLPPSEKSDESHRGTQNEVNTILENYNLTDKYPFTNVKITKNELEEQNKHNDDLDDVNVKDMSAKLKQLKIQLYKNTLQSEKKSACFWCTYDFDNAPCYIPKYEMDGTIYGYGSFCRPECAVAYLMKETIDDSTKFDRYHLLNQIYSKVYDCKKNIKPAPDPHYLLDKFYGNLNIQEYRRLLKTEHLLLVIDKPLTRILPELHEDTDDAFTKIYGIKATSGNASGVYKVKRQSEQPQGPSKASIIKSTFGI
jgi:hypothetical protein